jgi:CubicO group peptidase (beta-lactamase class C family)
MFRLYGLAIALTCWAAGLKAQDPAHFTANGRRIDIGTFNRQVEYLMDQVGVPGISLAIINDNKIVFSNVYGYKRLADKEKVDKETIFEGASLSKTFLVFVVSKLVDEGKIDLDKPMYQYLEYEPLEHDSRYKLITPRMILSHSSGIENWKWLNNPDTLEILANPGEKFVYSGEGYQYLAKVVEVILKKPYEEYVKEIVLDPLKLKRTYIKYTQDGAFPENYATGYNSFGNEVKKWKNKKAVPASGMNLTAEAYARLIIAIFDGKHLSHNRIEGIYQPVIRISDDAPLYFGLGLGVQYSPDDTIVFHNGFNDGFESMMWYSVVHKCGLVVLTNSEREHVMERRICDLSVGLHLDAYFSDDDYEQYPSNACDLFNIYKTKSRSDMLVKVAELENTRKLDVRTLNELGELFEDRDSALAKRLLEENTRLYPASPLAFYRLGKLCMSSNEYDSAYIDFMKAKDLNFDHDKIDAALKSCAQKLAARQK